MYEIEHGMDWEDINRKYMILRKSVEYEVKRVNALIGTTLQIEDSFYERKGDSKKYETICVKDRLFGNEVDYIFNFICYKNRDVYTSYYRSERFRCAYFHHKKVINVSVSVIGRKVWRTAFTSDFAHNILRRINDSEHIDTYPDSYFTLVDKTDKTDMEKTVQYVLHLSSRHEQDRLAETMYNELYSYDPDDYIPHSSCESYKEYSIFANSLQKLVNKKDDNELNEILGKLGYSFERLIAIGEFAQKRILRLFVEAERSSEIDRYNYSAFYCERDPLCFPTREELENRIKRETEDRVAALKTFIRWNSDSITIPSDSTEIEAVAERIIEGICNNER